MNIKDIMTVAVVSVAPETPVIEACKLMLDHSLSGLPVVDADGNLVGMLTEGDVLRQFELRQKQRAGGAAQQPAQRLKRGWTVADIMKRPAVTVDEDAAIGQLAAILDSNHIRRVPVVRSGRMVGIVSRRDLLRTIISLPPAQG